STNQGVSFGTAVQVATLGTSAGFNGDLGLEFRTNAFPQAVVNPANANQVYVVYDDNPPGSDRADAFFKQSTAGGPTWGSPVRVNDDATTRDQWQPALAVSPDGTRLFVGFYDRRLDSANSLINTYGTVATISGTTVTFQPNFRISN